jgi:hypothetical protein
MNTRHSRGISRAAAEDLLGGRTIADPGTDQLARVLAAASAPARDNELAGEQMVMAAFEANHLATSVTPQKEHTSMLAKFLTAKVLLTSLAAMATGGVALAATTGAIGGAHPATITASTPAVSASAAVSASPSATSSGHASSAPSTEPADTASPQATGTSSSTADPTTSPTSSASAASLPTTAAGLCETLAGDAGSTLSQVGLVQALSKPSVLPMLSGQTSEFSSLISTAGSVANVTDYCALLLTLPQLPDPGQLGQLPGTVLGQLLPALPASTLAADLASLPTATLSQVLSAVPASALSSILTELPSSALSQLLGELPTSTVSQLLTELPSSVLSQVLAELPSSLLSQLPTSLLGQL